MRWKKLVKKYISNFFYFWWFYCSRNKKQFKKKVVFGNIYKTITVSHKLVLVKHSNGTDIFCD